MLENLYPYQIKGALFLANAKKALLADGMGLGKTAQAIAACDLVGSERILAVVPASVIEFVKREFEAYRKKGMEGVSVISYDRAVSDNSWGLCGKMGTLIFDESQYLKSPAAKRTLMAYGENCAGVECLVNYADQVFNLSGTPSPNNPAELWPMCRALFKTSFVDPKHGKPMGYMDFVHRYCITRNNRLGHMQIVGGKNLADLKARLAPHFLRRKPEDVFKELPPIRFDTFPLDIKKAPQCDPEIQQIIEMAIRQDGNPADFIEDAAGHVATYRRMLGMAKVQAVVDLLKMELENGLDKVVVFAQHVDLIDQLHMGLLKYKPAIIEGRVSQKNRQKEVDRFQKDPRCRVFIGQNTAAGVGITLTAAANVVIIEPSWTPGDNDQMGGRCRRIGQTRPVLVRFVHIPNSLDERISEALCRKTATIKQLFD